MTDEFRPRDMDEVLDVLGEEEAMAAHPPSDFDDSTEKTVNFYNSNPEFMRGFLRNVVAGSEALLTDDSTIYDFMNPFDDEGNYIHNETQRSIVLAEGEQTIIHRVWENYGVELEHSDLYKIEGNLLKLMEIVLDARESGD